MRRLLPEWHPQWGVLMAWPHHFTDWASDLVPVEGCYQAIAREILARQNLLMLCQDDEHEQRILALLGNSPRLHLCQLPYNDTWARDFGPLCIGAEHAEALLDFQFNGWGGKFDAELDNQVSSQLEWSLPLLPSSLVLEGGSVEIDDHGRLLTTRQCLLNPNRNPQFDQPALEAQLRESLGVTEVWWLQHGHLEGDDTDAHIDTLARFCPGNVIAHVSCDDPDDSHYQPLKAMQAELEALAERHQLQLVALPIPAAQHDSDGSRLPATHANFLIINNAVLVPTYDDPTDRIALERLAGVFPGREVIGIDCRALIAQHGSLHCVTMQLPLETRQETSPS